MSHKDMELGCEANIIQEIQKNELSVAAGIRTENCIICGKKAVGWHGHVIGSYIAALGNHVEKHVIAGFCENHRKTDTDDVSGCYGFYDNENHGKCTLMFPMFDQKA